MKKYDSYKESGIEWIGEIPSHWDHKRLKYYIDYQKGRKPRKFLSSNMVRSEIYLTMDYLRGRAKQLYYVDSAENCVYVEDNELLLLWDGSNAGEFLRSKKGVLSSTMAILRAKNVNKDFLGYFLKNYEPFLKQKTIGMGVPHVNGNELKECPFTLPLPREQTAIAAYLDQKTAKIDELIADKKRLLELYEEEKKALINDLVTGKKVWNGHKWTPPAKVKDSGIEWLGEIPEHWVCKKLRYLCKITTGDKDTENREDVGGYPFFIRSQTVERISTFSFDGEGILTAGDGVGVCKVWHYVNEKFDFHQRVYLMFDFAQIKGKLLFHYMKENFIHDALRQSAKSTVDSLRRTMFLNFRVSFPQDIEEQNRLVKQIESELFRVDTQVNHTQRLIDLLTEYRIALISEVVTGRIKVMD